MRKKNADSRHHAERCAICRNPNRQDIEAAFLDWIPQAKIARQYGLGRLQVHRHAKALGLFHRRDSNVRAALGAFIERGAHLKPTPLSFVSAVVALSKLDAQSRTIERVELSNGLGSQFGRMTRGELRKYCETGALPPWFEKEKTGEHESH